MGKEDQGLNVATQNAAMNLLKDQSSLDQSSLLWLRDGAPLFAMTTGWGGRGELQMSLEWLEAFKCPQKLFVYTCNKWQEAVIAQISESLLRYPYHLEGEQYLFMNLVGAENRFTLLAADLNRNGRQASHDGHLLRTVPGSPFSWNTQRVRSA